jgi:hypothetical protein
MKNSEGVEFTPILCVDFDGVLNSYKSGWQKDDAILVNPPVPGALDWLEKAMKDWDVCVYSARSSRAGGIEAIKTWLLHYAAAEWADIGRAEKLVKSLKFPTQKPPAFLMIDDRAVCFDGNFAALDPRELPTSNHGTNARREGAMKE